ncbi:Kelch repeat-containing protein [Paludibacter propionicigenes]|nr:kelch repeat-containing protein [Paludibacter propionicigenes]
MSCSDMVESPYPSILFQKTASLPDIGRASAVAFVVNGKGYVTLGRNSNASDSLKDCWQYDPVLDNWTKKASFPGVARVKAIAVVVNDKAYVGLGFNRHKGAYSGGTLQDFWMYDPVFDHWTRKADFPSTATDASVSFVRNNSIYVGAGFNGSAYTNEFWKYNPDQDSWVRLKDFPAWARMCAVLCADENHVYFGTGYRFEDYNDWWEYFPATDSWARRKDMPDKGRVTSVGFSIANRYFVASGRHWGGPQTGGKLLSNIMEYDANRNTWYKRGDIPGGARENAVCFVINGKAYIGQGENNTDIINDFWSFEP